jgi:hypothetical protein
MGANDRREAMLREELLAEVENAVAFADYCRFLTAGRCEERSAQLIEVAEALMAETLDAVGLRHGGATAR